MKKLLVVCMLLPLYSLQLKAQTVKVFYKESFKDFCNPERGFYIPSSSKASNFILLDPKQLINYRNQPQQLKGATYSINVSLLYRAYELDNFKQRSLSDSFLINLQKDFDAVRQAGLKLILRFAYTNTANTGGCKDEYNICPPYGDAPIKIVMEHVQQLKPLFKKNADIIAVLQQGFIGIWGENYFTDYFGCATDEVSGVIEDSSWLHRNEFLKSLLNAMPTDRMVQVRTPQIKQRYVYGARAKVTVAPLGLQAAFTKIDKARIGFHNDCFLASIDDYGTFYDYGNSVSKRDTANYRLRKYFEADGRYVAVGGETCDDAFSPQNDCAPFGHAEKEMASMHYSYLNASYNNKVNNDWDSVGCMKSIKQKLGYRLVLQNANLPTKIKRGEVFTTRLHMANKGFAAPFNPRPVQLILRNKQTGKIIVFNFKTNVQQWFTGQIVLSQLFTLPKDAEKGTYEMLLNMPDGYVQLQKNPLYSIRLANENIWEPLTGYNILQHDVEVQ